MSANRGPAEDYLNQYKAALKVGGRDFIFKIRVFLS